MKRLVKISSNTNPPQSGRAGTTLVELLVSILLMGIGLATLMVLYPAAIFRTVRANQLTNGTILRYNAEAQLSLHPFDTIFNDHFNLSPGFNPRLTTDDDPQFLVLDPLGYIAARDDSDATVNSFAPNYGHDDSDSPTGIKRLPFYLPGDGFSALNECVDLDKNGTIDGNDAITRNFLRSMVTLPDSWEEFITTTLDTGTPPTTTSVTLDSSADLTGLRDLMQRNFPTYNAVDPYVIGDIVLFTDGGSNTRGYECIQNTTGNDPTNTSYWTIYDLGARIALFDSNGRGGHVININIPTIAEEAAGTITWANAVPTPFNPASARIEVSSPKFTWLMTLRREGLADPLADPLTETFTTQNQADLVVFFNRSFDIEDEHIHDSTGLPASAIRRGEPEVFLSDDGNLVDPPAEGNFIFDVDNCRWYKVVRVDEVDGYYNLTIDRNAVANSENIMLIRNVVDVYPLESFTTSIPPGP